MKFKLTAKESEEKITKEYEVTVWEELQSTVRVEAENEDEAYDIAMKLLAEDFRAPYHDCVDVIKYTVDEI